MNTLPNDPVPLVRGLGVVLTTIAPAIPLPAWRAALTAPLTAPRHTQIEGACPR